MFDLYIPTEIELEKVKLKDFLYPPNEPKTQDELLGWCLNSILYHDYHYHYSDDVNVWRSGEKRHEEILEKISLIEDIGIRNHLSTHFNKDKYLDVGNYFKWESYLREKKTDYELMRFKGIEHERACFLVGLIQWITKIKKLVSLGKCNTKVVYSDNIPKASKLLRDGISWYDNEYPLSPVMVSDLLWNELDHFGKLYKSNEIKFSDLKDTELYGLYGINVMFTVYAEILHISNFYMLFTYK